MSLKKFFAVLMLCIFTTAAFIGCGEDKKSDSEKYSIKIGVLKYTNIGEQKFSEIMDKVAETFSLRTTPHEFVFFDNLNSMQMAFESGKIDEISTYYCVASYLESKKANVGVLKDHTMEFSDNFCLALRESDKDLYSQVNDVVKKMQSDGTLAKLEREYITDLMPGTEPGKVEFENFDDADTIKVAVTGDLPPIDLILADGTPAGFNTAVLSEIGKRLHKNIEVVQIESAARAAALESNRVDISFWAVVPMSDIIPADVDKPAGIILTSPYYSGKIVHMGWVVEGAIPLEDLGSVSGTISK